MGGGRGRGQVLLAKGAGDPRPALTFEASQKQRQLYQQPPLGGRLHSVPEGGGGEPGWGIPLRGSSGPARRHSGLSCPTEGDGSWRARGEVAQGPETYLFCSPGAQLLAKPEERPKSTPRRPADARSEDCRARLASGGSLDEPLQAARST